MEKNVFLKRPHDILDLIRIVDAPGQRLIEDEVRCSVASFLRRIRISATNIGGHFEAEL